MTALRFTLRAEPAQRLDLSPLTPDRLRGLDRAAIERLPLNTTRAPVVVADLFRIRPGDPEEIIIEGGSARLDKLGAGMSGGSLLLDGDAGLHVGLAMSGGTLAIRGSTGPFAASGLKGGVLEIAGDAGDDLGGPLPGQRTGQRGGVVVVRGSTGDRAGDRMRRGVMIVEGGAGEAAGCRMIAGTLVICGQAGGLAGYLMRRGTLVLGQGAQPLPTFVPTGPAGAVFARLLGRALRPFSRRAARLIAAPSRRFAGDMAALGKGEMLLPGA
jgi:formylmethanofuran dehydrogenase subunit C